MEELWKKGKSQRPSIDVGKNKTTPHPLAATAALRKIIGRGGKEKFWFRCTLYQGLLVTSAAGNKGGASGVDFSS